jgi:uncharacterized protein with NAD-binding domain and iron-sulfur cluster
LLVYIAKSHIAASYVCLLNAAGAGVGGVATAARLAKAGFDVTVLEKNGFTGGRCSLIHHKDYV